MKKKKAILVVTFIIFFLAIFIPISKSILDKNMLQQIVSIVYSESDAIKIQDELIDEKDSIVRSCRFDLKTATKRCYVRYTKYFGTNEEVVDTYEKVDSFIRSIGWETKNNIETLSEVARMYELGYFPSEKYYKTDLRFNPELFLHFINENGLTTEREKEILSKYSGVYKYYYSISVKTDIILQ